MKIYKQIPHNKKIQNPVVSIGTFDGVHLGHKEIFKKLIEKSTSTGKEHIVITFSPHPRKVLNPETPPRILTTVDEKIEAISKCGIQNIIVLHFTRRLADMKPVDFLEKLLFSSMGISHLVIGYDHAFGRNRDGNWKYLKEISRKEKFDITRVDHLDFHARPVSSTWIRAEIEDGNISLANSLLGREYSLSGKIIKGAGIGKQLGFPTANIDPDDHDKVVPKDGVYAVSVQIDNGKISQGMINIGTNPTFSKTERTIEVNIFDFNQDVYDRNLKIFFYDRIRDEIKFKGPDDLVKQLKKDMAVTLSFFNKN